MWDPHEQKKTDKSGPKLMWENITQQNDLGKQEIMKGNFLPYGLRLCETISQNGILAHKVIRAVLKKTLWNGKP
jgi:hypothetical protein